MWPIDGKMLILPSFDQIFSASLYQRRDGDIGDLDADGLRRTIWHRKPSAEPALGCDKWRDYKHAYSSMRIYPVFASRRHVMGHGLALEYYRISAPHSLA